MVILKIENVPVDTFLLMLFVAFLFPVSLLEFQMTSLILFLHTQKNLCYCERIKIFKDLINISSFSCYLWNLNSPV